MTAGTETTRTGTDVARWLLPLLKEYTDKLNAVCDRLERFGELPLYADLSKARGLALRATFHQFLLDYVRQASSLLDHFQFDGDEELKSELANRWQEAEMALRTSDYLDTVAARFLARERDRGQQIKQLAEHLQTGALLE